LIDPTISPNTNFTIECLHRSLLKFFTHLNENRDIRRPRQLFYQVFIAYCAF
jgi:hypothetical protein